MGNTRDMIHTDATQKNPQGISASMAPGNHAKTPDRKKLKALINRY
jgi:hypothetical protein